MTDKSNHFRLLNVFLILVALHSFVVAIGLIFIPLPLMEFFGFIGYQGIFFKVQAGVFHLVMVVVYLYGASDPHAHANMIRLAILAKSLASVFLISYSFLVEMSWMVLLSGILDFGMAVILVWLYKKTLRIAGSAHE